jgi:hypothetical protein
MPISSFSGPRGNVFNYVVSSFTLSTNPTDLFSITAPALGRVAITGRSTSANFSEFEGPTK